MTLIHIANTADSNNQEYTELHRVQRLTFKIFIDFYNSGPEYTDATIEVLSGNREWTELAEYPVELWYALARESAGDERIAVFKTITDHLLKVGLEATGLMAATPAELAEDE